MAQREGDAGTRQSEGEAMHCQHGWDMSELPLKSLSLAIGPLKCGLTLKSSSSGSLELGFLAWRWYIPCHRNCINSFSDSL